MAAVFWSAVLYAKSVATSRSDPLAASASFFISNSASLASANRSKLLSKLTTIIEGIIKIDHWWNNICCMGVPKPLEKSNYELNK